MLHTGNGSKAGVEGIYQLPGTLYSILTLKRMKRSEYLVGSNLLVDLRIVLHRAGAQRIESGIDAEIHLAEHSIVAHHVRLAHFRKVERTLAPYLAFLRQAHLTLGQAETHAGGNRKFKYKFVVVFHIPSSYKARTIEITSSTSAALRLSVTQKVT